MRKYHRRAVCLLAFVLVVVGRSAAFSQVHVNGYTRKDGTYVSPHYRSAPDGNFYNNWSTKGNINPYTGELGTKLFPSGTSSPSGGEYLFLSDQIDGIQNDYAISALEESEQRLSHQPSDSPSPYQLALPSSLQGDIYPQQKADKASAGTLGQRIFSFKASFTRLDDQAERAVFGELISQYSLALNLPLNEFLDFRSSIGYLSSGSSLYFNEPFYGTNSLVDIELSGMSLGGNLVAHFQPGSSIDPFVFGGFSYMYLLGEASVYDGFFTTTETEEIDDIGYNLGVGIQIGIRDTAAFSPYVRTFGASEYGGVDTSIGAKVNLWGGDSLLLMVDLERRLGEAGSTELSGSFGLKF